MMPGMIMLWYGSEATIPSGWHLCDGTMGTPNLNGLLVPCAGAKYSPGHTGGWEYHRHYFEGDGHTHSLPDGYDLQAGEDVSKTTSLEPAAGYCDYDVSMPPFMALCYIMKLN